VARWRARIVDRVNIADVKAHENYYVTVKQYRDGSMHVLDQNGRFIGGGFIGEWLSTTPEGSFSPIITGTQKAVVVNLAMTSAGAWCALVVED
jgi:hypothetical protein